jgi:hypothetical protein
MSNLNHSDSLSGEDLWIKWRDDDPVITEEQYQAMKRVMHAEQPFAWNELWVKSFLETLGSTLGITMEMFDKVRGTYAKYAALFNDPDEIMWYKEMMYEDSKQAVDAEMADIEGQKHAYFRRHPLAAFSKLSTLDYLLKIGE